MNDNDIKQYFLELQTIQDIQISAFDIANSLNDDAPDLDAMIFERNRAFENLRSGISLVSSSVLNRFKKDVDSIIHKDKLFMTKLEDKKKELLKKINQSAKGKHLLKGYLTVPAKSLRFMNNKI